jgi:peptidoglycan/LPS O-acetylase OafA/YrhL
LEIARGIAALWVFLYHTKNIFIVSSTFIYQLAEYGYLGVPMFFVISGYVITYSAESTLKAERSPLSFLKKRFRRIYPVFWISLILVLLLPYLIEIISMLKSGSYQDPGHLLLKYTATEWSHFILLTKVFFSTNSDLQGQFNAINAVYWTIAIEFQFYLVIFIALFSKQYYRLIIAIVSMLAIVNLIHPFGVNAGLFLHYWPSFSVGILLAYIFKNDLSLSQILINKYIYHISSLALFLVAILAIIVLDTEVHRFVFSLFFAVIIWLIAPFEKILVEVKKNKKNILSWILEVFLALGAMSYSVYLLHAKLYQLPELFVRQLVTQDNILYGLLTIIFTLCLCYPFYIYVERHFMSKNYAKMHKDTLSTK